MELVNQGTFFLFWELVINGLIIFFFLCSYSLLLRFTDDTFDTEQAATIGVDFKVKVITVDGNNIKLAIWVNFAAECVGRSAADWFYSLQIQGHSRSGEVPNFNTQLLQKRTGCDLSLWCRQPANIFEVGCLARRGWDIRNQYESCENADCKQNW